MSASFWITTVALAVLDVMLMALYIKQTLSLLQNRHPEWEIDSLPPDGVLSWVKVGAAMLIPYLGLVISLVLMFFGEKLCVVAVMRIENRIELELIAEQYRNANGKILKEEEVGF